MDSKKILIVDDEETSIEIMRLTLRGKNRELIFATDGEEAVRMALEHNPVLILMDIMLPKINGFDAVRIIKNIPELKPIPVIAITARTGKFDETQARDAGCAEYVTKPFRMSELRDKVRNYLPVEDN